MAIDDFFRDKKKGRVQNRGIETVLAIPTAQKETTTPKAAEEKPKPKDKDKA